MQTSVHSERLAGIVELAAKGQFDEFLCRCCELADSMLFDSALQIDVGVLLASYGFLSAAQACFERAEQLSPSDWRAPFNRAALAHMAGDHGREFLIYSNLTQQLPHHPVVRRNLLTSLEYDPGISDDQRLAHARSWGEWAIARADGPRRQPIFRPIGTDPLRVGYVSADFCQHTVGLFVKDVLKCHDPSRVEVIAYSAGQVNDWVTDEIRAACQFRDVAALDDLVLAAQIRADRVDVLVDLSGHTAGSRLTAFAYRPAPVMVSWLGYFATTGLPYMDAVLMDKWHVPDGGEAQFVEPVVRLAHGRLCYQPVPWAPVVVAPPPVLQRGYITFGSFNNTAKLNDGVIDVWAAVLRQVPKSRIVLKWRTFNDEAFRSRITRSFTDRGIAADRIELRGPSFHAGLLNQYADIDIALDPFPFTGGLTTCEALWMGVPVVTWPQGRAVSRQTWAILNQIGLAELGASGVDDYVRLACELSEDTDRLVQLRASLRDRMRVSQLMNLRGFTRELEDTLRELYSYRQRGCTT
jgi:protein O-GlcNAc transferase